MFERENVVLIGMPGSGKTRLGRSLAEALGRPFFDTDEMLREKCGMTIGEVFACRGEAFFRRMEAECVAAVAQRENAVISTGGGVVLEALNMERLGSGGRVFFLDVSLPALALRAQGAERPLLAGDPGRLAALYAERRPAYLKFCDERIENDGSPAEGLALLLAACRKAAPAGPGRLLGVIGQPVCHSLSPAIHAALNAFAGLEYTYLPFCVSPENLPLKLATLRTAQAAGFNVTMPHKQAVLPLLDGVKGPTGQIMAVNAVKNEDGRLIGYNTDGEGFVLSAAAQGVPVAGKTLVILGAGGAAAAVAAAAKTAGAEKIEIFAVDPRQSERISVLLGEKILPKPWEEAALAASCREAGLVINATPLGMEGQAEWQDLSFLRGSRAAVFDLLYHPPVSKLLRAAAAEGLLACNGLPMLVYQAILSFEIFTGKKLPHARAAELVYEKLNLHPPRSLPPPQSPI
ncbi:MAG: hypothetical protein FWD39_04390 [Clostridiales bacterium]|nr:hypothetical protein [Clostridiales bacterium]